MAQASLRRFVLRVGRRLADVGSIAAAIDIFHLHRDEVPDLLRRRSDRRAVVDERERDLARFRAIRPPRTLGKLRPRAAEAIDSMASASPRPSPTNCAGPARRLGSSAVPPA